MANHYGIRISPRVCGGHDLLQPVYNGQDIASFWLKVKYDCNDEEEYIVSREHIPLSSHDLLHEIAHWVAAAPEQKDLPDYGLGALAFSTYHMGELGPSVVDPGEGLIQEFCSWLLCIHWGRKYHIPVNFSEEVWGETYARSWDEYQAIKESEAQYSPGSWNKAQDRFQDLVKKGLVI